MTNWADLLRQGERKALGQAKEGAALLLRQPQQLDDVLQVLKDGAKDGTLVAHGFYVLKEASLSDPALRARSLEFCTRHLSSFPQFEARENFLRIALIAPCLDKQLHQMALPMTADKSAIVAAYAVEYCLRFVAAHHPNDLAKTFDRFEKTATRAAVRARLRRLRPALLG